MLETLRKTSDDKLAGVLRLLLGFVFFMAGFLKVVVPSLGEAFSGQLVAAVPFLTTVWGYRPIEAGLALAPAPGSPCPF